MTIVDALHDLELFGRLPLFADVGSWRRSALPMTPDEMRIYQHHTSRQTPPTTPPSDIYVAADRCSRKSFMAGNRTRPSDADNALVEPASSPR